MARSSNLQLQFQVKNPGSTYLEIKAAEKFELYPFGVCLLDEDMNYVPLRMVKTFNNP